MSDRFSGFGQIEDGGTSAPFAGLVRASMVDENVTPCTRGNYEELRPVARSHAAITVQPEPGLVDESRGLERVVVPFAPHVSRGNVPKLTLDAVF